jgi:hypothetical protein
MIGRFAAAALLALAASPARAQESVFNLPAFGVPASGESIRARGLGGAGLGLEGEPFTLEVPAQLTRFVRTGLHLSAVGQRTDVEDRARSAKIEDVAFPMGQLVFPAWRGTALSLGFHQFVDFDAAVATATVFEDDTLPVSLRSEGGISIVAPGAAWAVDDRTSVGASLDMYLGSRLLVRRIDTGVIGGGALGTIDSVARDFRAVGMTLSVERVLGDARVAAAWRLRPSIDSEITQAPGGGLVGRTTEYDLPSELVLGGSKPLSRRLLAAAVLRWSDWGGLDDPAGSEYGSAVEIGGGIEFAPGAEELWVFGPEAHVRAGLRWRRLPLRIDGDPVDEWVASAGYGRAFWANWSRVDVVFEIGRRGDLDAVGITERFVRLGVGLSAFEQWRRGGPTRP